MTQPNQYTIYITDEEKKMLFKIKEKLQKTLLPPVSICKIFRMGLRHLAEQEKI